MTMPAPVTATVIGVALAAAVAVLPPVNAQAPADPAFEVASVKPNKSGDRRVMFSMPPGGRFTATNVAAQELVRQAYNVQPFQIVGGPAWLTSDRFDIVAKALEPTITPEHLRLMLRTLLVERFKLATHNDTRDMAVYSLVLARTDGRLGPKLGVAKVDCEARIRGRQAGAPPPSFPQPGQPMECGSMNAPGTMNAGGISMQALALSLSPQVGRIVIDKTGLTERYDLQLTYAPEGRGFGPGPGGAEPPIDPDKPSLFTALQEQLGLKLESGRGPVDVVVIDGVEPPTED